MNTNLKTHWEHKTLPLFCLHWLQPFFTGVSEPPFCLFEKIYIKTFFLQIIKQIYVKCPMQLGALDSRAAVSKQLTATLRKSLLSHLWCLPFCSTADLSRKFLISSESCSGELIPPLNWCAEPAGAAEVAVWHDFLTRSQQQFGMVSTELFPRLFPDSKSSLQARIWYLLV